VEGANDDGTPVGRVALSGDPTAAFESVQDASHGGGVETGALREGARAERTVTGDEVQAIEVDVVEIDVGTNLMVEQR
jgi:hypothetical protein